jgi:Amt family ammonium transporter
MAAGQLAWYITATALVLFMTPGVAFFYGGLARVKSMVNMMLLSLGAVGLIGVLWVLYGYNMGTVAAGEGNLIPGVLGNPFSDFGLGTLAASEDANDGLAAVAFGATFAIITVALISGAVADRAKFGSWMLFAGIWATLVYFPVQGWVWGLDADGNPAGWIAALGTNLGLSTDVIDYAGGTAVHINAGAAALALALVLGKRIGFPNVEKLGKPSSVPLVVIGASILFFGWFGFNGGAAAGDEALTGLGLITLNTLVATAAALLGWSIVDRLSKGRVTATGASSGVVAGLVAITPSCANLTPFWAIVLGLVAGAVSSLAVGLKYRWGYDDSLDVVGVHLVSGFIGTLWLGFFATDTGLFTGGNLDQLTVQFLAAVSVAVYSFVMAYIIAIVIEKTIGFRVPKDIELAGIDLRVHGEEGYALTD